MFDSGRKRDHDPVRQQPRQFQSTCWSAVFSAQGGDAEEAREAMAALCAAYWYPLYAFVRRKGYDAEAAQDLVQGFFARLVEKSDLATVERGKGKFRSFLMAACSHYLANQADRDRVQKRGGGRSMISIDGLAAEERYRCEPAHTLTPDRLFDRQWTIALLDNVLKTLTAEMTQAGKTRQFEALRPALLRGVERTPYAKIASELGLTNEAARAAAQRLRRRYRELLVEEVVRTVDDTADVDEEIRSLFASLAD